MIGEYKTLTKSKLLFHTPPGGAHCTQGKNQSRDLRQLTEQLECLGFAVNPALNLEMLAAELFFLIPNIF